MRRCIYNKKIFELDLGVIRNVAQYPLHHMTYAPAKLKLLRPTVQEMHYKKIHYLTFDLGVKVIQNVAHYPLHHMTYAAAKFEVAIYKGLGINAFTS